VTIDRDLAGQHAARPFREDRDLLLPATGSDAPGAGAAPGGGDLDRSPAPLDSRLQVIVCVPARSAMIASVPAAVRAARAVAALDGAGPIILCTRWAELPRSWRRSPARRAWTHVGSSAPSPSLADVLDPGSPVLVVGSNTVPEPSQLRELLAGPIAEKRRTTWLRRGVPVAAYYPAASALLTRLTPGFRELPEAILSDPDACDVDAPDGSWHDLNDRGAAREAERQLYRSLRQPGDGYLARLDRTVSIAVSRWLIRTPVTPNVITGASFVVGLSGATLLASGTTPVAFLGALLLWTSCILDGCDGEVARLKLLSSPFGARLDVATDNAVHLATFVALTVHVHRVRPDLSLLPPALVLLLGVVASMATVAWLINRRPPEDRLGLSRAYERVASRDYVYVVVVLTAIERLEWFVWAAAIGANVFWLSLWLWERARRTR
jgi:phosphatidylglycerophosphate synthase